MSEWEPATDAEVAMRDALRTDDQESYFRILSGVDLLLPVSADALAGLAPLGWGTWSTGGRTHVLAFTSTAALQACLADYTGSARRVPYQELANTWPNLEWWLAVNPGLPIEGYLPAWFVAQLSRGDLRLPTRGPGREATPASAKMQDLQAAALAANAAATGQEEAARPGGPTTDAAPVPATAAYPQYPSSVAPPSAYGQAASAAYGEGNTPYGQPVSTPPAYEPPGQPAPSAPAAYGQAAGAAPAYGQPYGGAASPAAPGFGQPSNPAAPGFGQPSSPAAPGFGQPSSPAAPGFGQPGSPAAPSYGRPVSPAATPISAPPVSGPGGAYAGQPDAYSRSAGQQPPAALPSRTQPPTAQPPTAQPPTAQPPAAQPPALQPAGPSSAEPIGPGGLPIRTPGSVMPSGLPARTPSSASSGPASAAPLAPPMAPPPATPPRPASAAPLAPPPTVPSAYQPPSIPIAPASGIPSSGIPASSVPASGIPSSSIPSSSIPASGIPASGIPASGIPASGIPASGPPSTPTLGGAFGALGSRRSAPPSDLQDPNAPLPVRNPGANTPPVPEHFVPSDPAESTFDPGWAQPTVATPAGGLPRRTVTPPADEQRGGFPQGPASPQAAAVQQTSPAVRQTSPAQPGGLGDQPGSEPGRGFGTPLPRRQATSPSAGPPPSMTSFPAFQTRSDAARAEAPAERLAPPVIPGSPGNDRLARPGGQPAPAAPSYGTPPPVEPFVPANDVERELFDAAGGGSTDAFLSTLLLATVLVPVADHSRPGSAPGESGFAFRTEQMDGEAFLIVFTSKDRLAEHYAQPTRTVGVRFYELIRNWPDPAWSFAVNPNSPIGAKYPGPQVIALANWAADAGLGTDPDAPLAEDAASPVPAPEPASDDAQHATVMQKTLPPDQVDYYLERGYDRVAGFVHRATEVEHLRTPGELFAALGLSYDGSQHQPDAKEAFVLRWPAYRPSLYRIPYGGQNEQALRAMDGWVIERAPFRGNGFAPGEGRDVIAEFKVDSVRLPHGSQLWRIDADGNERMVAIFDNDGPLWRRVGEQ
ncbi:SseB family protein [Actinoplanes sp. NPDC048796]|uniref:SseB family protein n=1 Tax=Actinoplanes sp. NPDC048796 TaxID=3155640 RepID=UPI0033CB2CC2